MNNRLKTFSESIDPPALLNENGGADNRYVLQSYKDQYKLVDDEMDKLNRELTKLTHLKNAHKKAVKEFKLIDKILNNADMEVAYSVVNGLYDGGCLTLIYVLEDNGVSKAKDLLQEVNDKVMICFDEDNRAYRKGVFILLHDLETNPNKYKDSPSTHMMTYKQGDDGFYYKVK